MPDLFLSCLHGDEGLDFAVHCWNRAGVRTGYEGGAVVAEIRYWLGLVYKFDALTIPHRIITIKHVKWPLLCIALALIAGCGSMNSHPVVANPAPVDLSTPIQPPGPPMKWELPVPEHPAIDMFVYRFSEKYHKSFQTQLDRSYYYALPAKEILEKQGLPKDLIYVALVESGFSPTARSHAKAVGMWQIISTTGTRFGLKQDKYVDERCHPFKSAKAAADYLSFLYDKFGSWPLALAAYNCGENAVQAALDKSGLKTFWELLDNGYLPSETRDYVPKVYAAVKIIRNPEYYGFQFDPNQYIARHETVPVPGGVKLAWIEKQTGIPEDSLIACNPELCKPVTPPGCSDYELCVPVGKGEDVLTSIAQSPPQKEEPRQSSPAVLAQAKASAQLHWTRPGDSCISLAKKYKCSPKELAALNGIRLTQPIKPGQVFKIPSSKSSSIVAANQVKNGRGASLNTGKKKPGAPGSKKKAQRSYS
jgi:membrane-bound lytic murein transglycosylase D